MSSPQKPLAWINKDTHDVLVGEKLPVPGRENDYIPLGWYSEIERLRGQVEQYKHMCRYDWIQQQERVIRELKVDLDKAEADAERWRRLEVLAASTTAEAVYYQYAIDAAREGE